MKKQKCYVCNKVDGEKVHKIALFRKMETENVELPICEECYNNFNLFKKVLTIFMFFLTVFVMFMIVVAAYFVSMSGDKQTAKIIFFLTLPTALFGYLLTRKMYNSSHFIQKAANEPLVKNRLDEGFTGFKVVPQ